MNLNGYKANKKGLSYKEFEEEASDLFATIESRHKGKGVAGTSSSPNKSVREQG